MKDRIDPLIAERAPWLFRQDAWSRMARRVAERSLSYDQTVQIGREIKHLPTPELMSRMAEMLAKRVRAHGLHRIPANGPALIVANHPTGIADGIILHHLIAERRSDLFIYANSDILKVLPQMKSLIVPVEWRRDKRCHAKTRATLQMTSDALQDGRIGLIFPSGRLAKRSGLQLFERDWMTSAAMIARKYDVPIVPINIQARNSILFYLLDFIHPTLRDITLFHETLNKHHQPFRIKVGRPISPGSLPASSTQATQLLKQTCLALGAKREREISMVRTTGWLPHRQTLLRRITG